jgi:acetyl-CoA carboxylase biotin carboxyl carrier protein
MNYKEIQELLKMINRSEITEFKYKQGDFSLSIKANRAQENQVIVQQMPSAPAVPVAAPTTAAPQVASVPAAEPAPAKEAAPTTSSDAALVSIKSPIVGTFYRAPSVDKPPYIKVGDTVKVGQVVCIVEAMKLFNEIESDVAGKVVKIVTDDASPVEYDQVLFLVDPKG